MIRVLFITFFLAACSLVYELSIAQAVSMLAFNNVIWYSLVIGIFICSMGLGAALSSKVLRKKELWQRLVVVEILLSIAGGLSVIVIHWGHAFSMGMVLQGVSEYTNLPFFISAFVMAMIVGTLTGLELPLLIEMAEKALKGKGIDPSARVLSVDYFGSLCGAVIFPLVLLPHFDVMTIVWLIAIVNLAVGASIVISEPKVSRSGSFLTLSIVALLFIGLLTHTQSVEQSFLKGYYYYNYPKQAVRADVEHSRSAYQSIDIVKLGAEGATFLPEVLSAYSQKFQRDPSLPQGFALYLNNDFQFYANVEEFYHETFAHIPIALAGKAPQEILILGGGDGLLARELLKYSSIKRILQVDIDPEVVELFRSDERLTALNHNAYADPRLDVQIDDAYHFIRTVGDKTFDAIYLDLPAPSDFGLSKVYSMEFYALIKKHLSSGGFLALDVPGLSAEAMSGAPLKIWPIMKETLRASGFSDIQPFLSYFDENEPKALAVLKRELAQYYEPHQVDQAVREELRSILDGLAAGFLFVRPERPRGGQVDFSLPVQLDVLTPQRAMETTGPYFALTKPVRGSVNSIFKPVLPDLSDLWEIRTPY